MVTVGSSETQVQHVLWDDILAKIHALYGGDFSGHKYKFEFFSAVIEAVPPGPIDVLGFGPITLARVGVV